jgi:hypothetical protein
MKDGREKEMRKEEDKIKERSGRFFGCKPYRKF